MADVSMCEAIEAVSDEKAESKLAVVIGIDDECHLLVKYPDGTEDCYSSGKISIRI